MKHQRDFSPSGRVNTIGRAGAEDAGNMVMKSIALTRSVLSSDAVPGIEGR